MSKLGEFAMRAAIEKSRQAVVDLFDEGTAKAVGAIVGLMYPEESTPMQAAKTVPAEDLPCDRTCNSIDSGCPVHDPPKAQTNAEHRAAAVAEAERAGAQRLRDAEKMNQRARGSDPSLIVVRVGVVCTICRNGQSVDERTMSAGCEWLCQDCARGVGWDGYSANITPGLVTFAVMNAPGR